VSAEQRWSIGIDLGGTKTLLARVDGGGKIGRMLQVPTNAARGAAAVKKMLIDAVRDLLQGTGRLPAGIGVGVAGQVDPENGAVKFAPNLGWQDEPFREDLEKALRLPVVVTNDVRAATWGEWLYGAGKGCNDVLCLFVGTGIGGGVVSGGQVLTGCSNTAGELGHITIDINGPRCHCGNRGCMEALAGGWAIAREAREKVKSDPKAGAAILKRANGQADKITAKIVTASAKAGDPLALALLDRVALALAAGSASLVNAFNPCRIIFGGGVVEGYPRLIGKVARGLKGRALPPALEPLRVVRSKLGGYAGVVGSAALVMHVSGRISVGGQKKRC
jgi:glucokinase